MNSHRDVGTRCIRRITPIIYAARRDAVMGHGTLFMVVHTFRVQRTLIVSRSSDVRHETQIGLRKLFQRQDKKKQRIAA